ncbi:MAG: hypothetical protein Q4F69_11325 [Bacteroidia bacterium]|nr:hypothetical protein [Bacteroidia bacterium]
MKRLSVVLLALAVMFGFSRCNKRPNFPVFDGNGFRQSVNVDIAGGGGSEKGDFERTATNALRYKWNKNDVVYVYCLDANEVGIGFAGEIYTDEGRIKTDTDGKCYASFHGEVKIVYGTKKLRFIHYGSAIDAGNAATTGVTADYSTQCGTLEEVSSKVVATCDKDYSPEGKYDDCAMAVNFAVAWLSFENFLDENVELSGITANQLHVDKNGNITETSNSASKDGAVTTFNHVNNQYYAVFINEGSETDHTFKDSEVEIGLNCRFYKDKFFMGENGASYVLAPTGLVYKKFSVAADKQVYFTKGNMYWDGDSFEFEQTQDAYRSLPYPDVAIKQVGHFYWHPWSRVTKSYVEAYDATGQSTNDVFFTNYQDLNKKYLPNPEFEIAGVKGKYRVLTDAEMTYLKSRNGGALWGYAVKTEAPNNGHLYLVICPDGFTAPDDVTFKKSEQTNLNQDPSSDNGYDNSQFAKMEAAGVVFLPVGDARENWEGLGRSTSGLYVLADPGNYSTTGVPADQTFKALAFGYCTYGDYDYHNRKYGYQVRLVFDAAVNDGNTNDYGDGGDVNW